ncbi:MAG: HAD family phosphatase [Candidatus Nomurabacteria bacterium]|jgi:beta-phosphoglucomutase-like phosphatase (HAD superfamily)|nr:HAD family phosphatase [Candidatus Nomurabacteria bacterium]
MKPLKEFDVDKFEVAAFDWDGTLVDSPGKYRELDQIFVREYYGVEKSVKELRDLFNELWDEGDDGDFWEKYYQHFDQKFGNGDKSVEELTQARQKYLHKVQSEIEYKENADAVLQKMRANHTLKLALATASKTFDIDYISEQLQIRGELNPKESFDLILTMDDVEKKKPHPEIYNQVLGHFATLPSGLVVVEDSLTGVIAAKTAGATVINKIDEFSAADQAEIDAIADFKIEHYDQFLEVI